uniref:Death-on-curing protein n=1 Tax=uncultured organism TaxID=155900 RepID=M1Q2C7_9ZZZZ|nr:death-on-curing protein [uncultured organism]
MLERPLSEESIKVLHKWVLKNDPNTERGYTSESLIGGSMEHAMGVYYGEEQYEDIFEKAAVFIHSIITFHPFVDGNKRTALLSTFFLLLFHGYGFNISSENVIQTLLDIADGKKNDIKEIANWLKKNSKKFHLSARIILGFFRAFTSELNLSILEKQDNPVSKFYSVSISVILNEMGEEWPED